MNDLHDVETQFLLCRRSGGFGHQFYNYEPVGRRTKWGYRVHLRCVRCGTTQHDVYDINGNVASRQYRYPKGYRITVPVTTEDVRLEVVRRLRSNTEKRVKARLRSVS